MNTYYPSDRYWKTYPLPYLHVKLAVPMPHITEADMLTTKELRSVLDDLFTPKEVALVSATPLAVIPDHIINRGMIALDEVKHCEDKMTPLQRANDKTMRNTAPIRWTREMVSLAETTASWVNTHHIPVTLKDLF